MKGDHSIQVLYKNNSLFSLVAPKSNVSETINLQLREVILLVSEPRRHRCLRNLHINNECFKWQALTWALTSTKTLQWNSTSIMMMLMRWKSMTWSFMMINFLRRTIHVWLAMQTCPRSWIKLLFPTQPKNQNWVLMSSCVWTHSQTSLNFRGWSVCRFHSALMQCHLLQKFWALDLCALGARSAIQRARQYGWGDQGLLLANLLGWSPKEKTYSVQLLAVSFPEFCQQLSWRDATRKTWWWPAWTWEMLFWLRSKSETPWSIQQMQVEQLAVFFGEGAAWTTWWKLAVVSCNHQFPQIKAWLGGAHPISDIHAFFVQKMDLAWWWYMLMICLWLESVTMCWLSSCRNSKLHMVFQSNALRNQVMNWHFWNCHSSQGRALRHIGPTSTSHARLTIGAFFRAGLHFHSIHAWCHLPRPTIPIASSSAPPAPVALVWPHLSVPSHCWSPWRPPFSMPKNGGAPQPRGATWDSCSKSVPRGRSTSHNALADHRPQHSRTMPPGRKAYRGHCKRPPAVERGTASSWHNTCSSLNKFGPTTPTRRSICRSSFTRSKTSQGKGLPRAARHGEMPPGGIWHWGRGSMEHRSGPVSQISI